MRKSISHVALYVKISTCSFIAYVCVCVCVLHFMNQFKYLVNAQTLNFIDN